MTDRTISAERRGGVPALGIEVIFKDRRDPLDRRSRRSGSSREPGAFVNCRRDEDRDRRGRMPLIPNASWWLQRDYLDWEADSDKKNQGLAAEPAK